LEEDITEGTTSESRRQDRPRTAWTHYFKGFMDVSPETRFPESERRFLEK